MRIQSQYFSFLSVPKFFFFFVFSLFLGFWFLYWPGIYSPDVSYALLCADRLQGLPCFLTENSLFWAWLNYLSAYWNSSFSVFLFLQILFISFVYSYGLRVYSSSKKQRNLYLLLFFFQLASLLPLRMAVFVERDALYGFLWFFVLLLWIDSWKDDEESLQQGRVRFLIMLIVSILASLLRSEGWLLTGVFLFSWRFQKKKSISLSHIFLILGGGIFCFWSLQSLQRWINPNAQATYLSHFHRSYVPFMVWEKGISIPHEEEEFLKQVYRHPPVNTILPEVRENSLNDPGAHEKLQKLSLELLISYPHYFLLHRILLLQHTFLRTPVHYGRSQRESAEDVGSKPGETIHNVGSWRLRFYGPFRDQAIALEQRLDTLFAHAELRLFVFQPTLGLLTLGILLCFSLLNPVVFPLLCIPLFHFIFLFLFQFAAMPKHFYLQYLCLLLLPILLSRRSLKS